jgi:hypothetical protein
LHYFKNFTYPRPFWKYLDKFFFVNFTSESLYYTSFLLLASLVHASIVCALEYGPALVDTSQFFGVPALAGIPAIVGDIAFAGIVIAVASLVAP